MASTSTSKVKVHTQVSVSAVLGGVPFGTVPPSHADLAASQARRSGVVNQENPGRSARSAAVPGQPR